MFSARKRLLLFIMIPAVWLLVTALLYRVGMNVLEGEPRDFWSSLEWAAETFTTTGYGKDSNWEHPLMVLFVVLVQLFGILLIVLIFPLYILPFFEERFEVRLPTEVPDQSDHIVIYRYGPAVESFLEEVDKAGLGVVVVEPDEGRARRLLERGSAVVFGKEEDGALSRAHFLRAGCLVCNGTDDENANIILSARQAGFEGQVLAMVEEPNHRQPMMLAGATAVYTPRHILGAALAARACRSISPALAGIQQLGRKLHVAEVRVAAGSGLIDKTLAQAEVGQVTGATVLGQWVGGRLVTSPTADTKIERHGILIVAGSEESLEEIRKLAGAGGAARRDGPFVVAGYGEVGQKVTQMLRDAGETVEVIDIKPRPGVDLIGDLLEQELLEQSSVRTAQAVILAVNSDSATLFGTVILKEFAPEVPVIARVNRAENVERIHGAGALFALSISQVSGQMLARRVLGEEAIALDLQLKLLKVAPGTLAGVQPKNSRIREKTGCSVVAVERGDEVIVDFDDTFRFEESDVLYVAGTPEATGKFSQVL